MSLVTPAESVVSLIKRDLPHQPCWIEPGFLPKRGKLLFGGHAKAGKSFVALEVARALATGTSPFDWPYLVVPNACKVLLIEAEIGPFGLRDRVSKAYATSDMTKLNDNLWYVSKQPELKFDTSQGRQAILNLIEQVKPNVLLLDPISKMHGYDENDNSQMAQLFNFMDVLLKQNIVHDMALGMSHHFGKPVRDPSFHVDPLSPYNFRGASKFYDEFDTLMTINKLYELPTPHKSWVIETGFDMRQAEPPEQQLLAINEQGDLRVRYKGERHPKDRIKEI